MTKDEFKKKWLDMTLDQFNAKWNKHDFFARREDAKFVLYKHDKFGYAITADEDGNVIMANTDDRGVIRCINNAPFYCEFGGGLRCDFEAVVETATGDKQPFYSWSIYENT